MSSMVDVYYKLVKEQSKTIEQVPDSLRAAVKAKIEADAKAATL